MTSLISTVSWGMPADWVDWPRGGVTHAAAKVSALDDDPTTTAAVMASVRAFESIIEREVLGTACAALWVPVSGVRKPLATAVLRTAAPPPTGRMDVEALSAFVREGFSLPRGHRLLDVAVAPGRLSAGEAVLRIVDRAPRFTRRVTREWTWFILPPGTDRTVGCQFESSSVAHFDELAEIATDIANSVEVALEGP